jgi:hypothetical protein
LQELPYEIVGKGKAQPLADPAHQCPTVDKLMQLIGIDSLFLVGLCGSEYI